MGGRRSDRGEWEGMGDIEIERWRRGRGDEEGEGVIKRGGVSKREREEAVNRGKE